MSEKPTKTRLQEQIEGLQAELSNRKRLETELRQSEEKLRGIFDTVYSGIILVDAQGVITFANRRMGEMLGAPPEELVGTPYLRYAHGTQSPEAAERMRQLISGDVDHVFVERLYRRIDGTTFWGLLSGRRLFYPDGSFWALVGVIHDISDQKRTEAALRESEQKYREIFESIVDIYYRTDANGVVELISPSCERISGHRPDELIGKNMAELYVNPANRETFLTQLLEREEVVGFEAAMKAKGGSTIWVSTNAQLMRDTSGAVVGVQGITRDITDRIRSRRALIESEERFRQVFNHMGNGVAVYEAAEEGQDFIFKDINPAGAQIGNIAREAHFGRSVLDVYPGVKKSGLFEVFQRVWRTGRAESFPLTLYQDDRINLWVENYVCKLPSGEIVAVYKDLTRQKQDEEQRQQLQGQLRQRQKMESLGTLAGGIAHDFNNILSSVLGFSEIAYEDAEEGSRMRENLAEIVAAGKRARDLVKQILVFSRHSENEKRPLEIGALASETLKMMRPMIPSTIDIQTRIGPDRLVALADPAQINQVIVNLTTNAAQAMEDEGGTLTVTAEAVSFTQADAAAYPDLSPGRYVRLSFRDTGAGMPPEIVDRIFDPYFSTKEPHKGTGLGLAVVHGIVRAHEGHITVDSEAGRGAEFRVYLPRTAGVSEAAAGPQKEALPTGNERILFVDDEPAIASVQKQILSRLGYRVVALTDSTAALEAFHKEPNGFDLVITDMTMPGLTGDQLARRVKAARPDLPVILCTGYSERVERVRAEESIVDGVLTKPAVRFRLARMIRDVLEKKKG